MPLILRVSESLALEDVPKMASTVVANNLGPHHSQARVGLLPHSIGECVPESWPSAARVELVVGFVERCRAPGAAVNACIRVVLVELAGPRRFSALLAEDAELLCRCVNMNGSLDLCMGRRRTR